MIRHLFLAAPLALTLLSTHAQAAGKTPPPEYAAYVAAVRKADAIQDDLQRCLAYPDLPGNTCHGPRLVLLFRAHNRREVRFAYSAQRNFSGQALRR